ncbi:hypothetical protein ABIA35_006919 [Catenulispora sp. MAP12-49]
MAGAGETGSLWTARITISGGGGSQESADSADSKGSKGSKDSADNKGSRPRGDSAGSAYPSAEYRCSGRPVAPYRSWSRTTPCRVR